jgi:magnesium transporter
MSLKTVQTLLERQLLAEDLLRRQEMPRHELVESTLHKQHKAELKALLAAQETSALAGILEALPPESLFMVWEQIDPKRTDEVLAEVAEGTRELLSAHSMALSPDCQVNAFELANGRLQQTAITSLDDLEGISPVWVDMVATTKADRRKLEQRFGIELPDPKDLTDIETSARFYIEENGEMHLHSDFLLDREGDSRNVPVALILYKETLFTVREEELPVFRLQRLRARMQTGYVTDGMDVLLDLYAVDAEYSADSLEEIYTALGLVGKHLSGEALTDEEAAHNLADISEVEDLNGRIRKNVMDTRRALTFLIRTKKLSQPQLDDVQQILRDIESLDGHTSFLVEKINFLLDATVGFVNINQNKVIYRLTILSIIFLPLNLIAGIGGMSEYTQMTRAIPWQLSYAAFTISMVLIGWITYYVLRLFGTRKRIRKPDNS